MESTYVDKNYVYAVAAIRSEELKLLNASFLDQLIQAKSADECMRILAEKGWGREDTKTPEDMLAAEREKTWETVTQFVPNRSVFDVFLLENDYNNLKAAIKESVMEYDYPGIYIKESTVPFELIRTAIKERDYEALPDDMQEIAKEAHDTFLHTKDGQLCDVMVDKACLLAILKAGKESKNEFLSMYSELIVAGADIKIAVRAAGCGKDKDFILQALAPCDTVEINALSNAAMQGTEAVCSYLATTDYADAADRLKESPQAFECWCDDLIITRMRSELYHSFGLGPIAAYVLARENEIKSVRIILSAKLNGFPEEIIRERVRETYV